MARKNQAPPVPAESEEDYEYLPTPDEQLQRAQAGEQLARQDANAYRNAVESNFTPKQDANTLEYRLSSEELLERIEHFLRGDVLKTKTNESGQPEVYYTTPTKRVYTMIVQGSDKIKYYVLQFVPGKDGEPMKEEWRAVSAEGMAETDIFSEEDGKALGALLYQDFNEKKAAKLGYAYREIEDSELRNLNDFGVTEILRILSMYITKETFLSFYTIDEIREKMLIIGTALNIFLRVNYRFIGLDTEYKKTKYELIFTTIIDSIESAYRRALGGKENVATREIIIRSGSAGLNAPSYPMQMMMPNRKWSLFNRKTW